MAKHERMAVHGEVHSTWREGDRQGRAECEKESMIRAAGNFDGYEAEGSGEGSSVDPSRKSCVLELLSIISYQNLLAIANPG
jgi:hypothetical protein